MSTERRFPGRAILSALVLFTAIAGGIFLSLTIRAWVSAKGDPVGRRDETRGLDRALARPPARPGVPEVAERLRALDPVLAPGEFLVVDAFTLSPLESAKASIEHAGQREDVTVSGGRFDGGSVLGREGVLRVEAPAHFAVAGPIADLPAIEGEPFYIPLVPQAELGVRCLVLETREPVFGARVRATTGSEFPVGAVTNEEGEATLSALVFALRALGPQTGLPELEVQVRVEADGFLEKTAKVEVRPGETWGHVELLLESSRTFVVRVLDGESKLPIEGALVVHQWNYLGRGRVNHDPRVAKTDARGEVPLAVREGASGIEVLAAEPEHATTGVQIEDLDALPGVPSEEGEAIAYTLDEGVGPIPLLVLEMEAGVEAEGLVLDADGLPVVKALVDLDPVDRPDYSDWMRFAANTRLAHVPDITVTDSDGRFTLGRLGRGEYRVSLNHREYSADPENPPLRAGTGGDGSAWVGIMRRGLEIRGRLVDDAGTALQGFVVTLLQVDAEGRGIKGSNKVMRTREDGSFTARGVSPGRYQAHFYGGPGHAGSSRYEESSTLPDPWVVVLQRKPEVPEPVRGTLWLRLRAGDNRVVQGTATVRLHRVTDGVLETSVRDEMSAGEIFRTDTPCGLYHAVVSVAGYAPSILPALEVRQSTDEPQLCLLESGLETVVEVAGFARPGVLEVEERRYGLEVAQEILVPEEGRPQRAVFRVLPGAYDVRFRVDGGATAEGILSVGSSPGASNPGLRLEAPAGGP